MIMLLTINHASESWVVYVVSGYAWTPSSLLSVWFLTRNSGAHIIHDNHQQEAVKMYL